jgi:uncharacterized caspase-like protein
MAVFPGYALIVGVGAYAHAPALNLLVAADDAKQVADALREPAAGGYLPDRVILLCDAQATRAGILGALEDLAARVTKDDTVFLFYTGHGKYGADGSYFFTTHDTQLDADGNVVDGIAVQGEGCCHVRGTF